MAKKYFTDESLATLVSESKAYTDSAVSTKANISHGHDFSELTVNDTEAAKTALDIENGMVLKELAVMMPSSGSWSSVAYGNGKFVAVTTANQRIAACSEDGITWTASTLPSTSYWSSVAYGNGKFVSVTSNTNDKAAYSEDGITWTTTTMPSSGSWDSVAYGNGKFVSVASNSDKAAYSEDGITWTAATLPSSANWRSITYGNGKFVAVASNSTQAAYSEDGITWTATTMPSSGNWSLVAYSNGKFVAIAGSSTQAAYSEDGITWTATTMPSSGNWNSVTYGNGKFVVVSFASNAAAYSEDGITWTPTKMPRYITWISTYGKDKFVALAMGSDTFAYSYDGITWYDSIQYISQNDTDITADTLVALKHTHDEYAQVSYVDEQLSTQLATKQNTLTGTQGQVIGFDANGNAVATNGIYRFSGLTNFDLFDTLTFYDNTILSNEEIFAKFSESIPSEWYLYNAVMSIGDKNHTNNHFILRFNYYNVNFQDYTTNLYFVGTYEGANIEASLTFSAIDGTYVTSTISRTPMSSMPTVTTSDNGKFLRVVNGAWAAATVPNAEEVSF